MAEYEAREPLELIGRGVIERDGDAAALLGSRHAAGPFHEVAAHARDEREAKPLADRGQPVELGERAGHAHVAGAADEALQAVARCEHDRRAHRRPHVLAALEQYRPGARHHAPLPVRLARVEIADEAVDALTREILQRSVGHPVWR